MTVTAGEVRYERQGSTAFITFARPSARNAMTWAMYEQLAAALAAVNADADVRVAVLRGSGGTFVAGTDISQFAAFTSASDGIAYERQIDATMATIEQLRVPTIAAVEGDAMGGGLAIATACDIRICTPNARFGVPIARTVGNALSMANYARLVMHVGIARTKALLLTAEAMTAEAALASGYVTEVAASDIFEERIAARCHQLASHAPLTIQVTREAIRRIVATVGTSGADLLERVYGSRDFHEGVEAFLSRRAPRWEGR